MTCWNCWVGDFSTSWRGQEKWQKSDLLTGHFWTPKRSLLTKYTVLKSSTSDLSFLTFWGVPKPINLCPVKTVTFVTFLVPVKKLKSHQLNMFQQVTFCFNSTDFKCVHSQHFQHYRFQMCSLTTFSTTTDFKCVHSLHFQLFHFFDSLF